MREPIRITYIHHDCFVLRRGGRAYLFDPPGDDHLPEGGREVIRNAVAGSELAVFVTHSHGDHCSDDLEQFAAGALSAAFIISDDVPEMREHAVPESFPLLVVEPDEDYSFGEMRIATRMSNDLGVAFFVEDRGFRIYFGGDLALWLWDGASPAEIAHGNMFFSDAIAAVNEFRPHVAFSNFDPRLPNRAGGQFFHKQVDCQLFVPMHTFGDLSVLESLRPGAGRAADVFVYADCGESREFLVSVD